jgi:hypothetical protein
LWKKVLQTPSAQNSFGTGGAAFGCWDLGGTVAPFGPQGITSCTVKPGTKIFVATTWECSTFPGDHGADPGPVFGTTEPQLRACARHYDVQHAPSVTVDGHSVPVPEVETRAVSIVLPADNILGAPSGHGVFVAHGWVTLLRPLTPGKHTIVIRGATAPMTTTITVKPGH